MANDYLVVVKREDGTEYHRQWCRSKRDMQHWAAVCKRCPDVHQVETFSGPASSPVWKDVTHWERKQQKGA